MFAKTLLILTYFVSSAFTAPALIPAQLLQQPLLLQSPQLLRSAPNLAIVERSSLPLAYSYYQTNPYGHLYLLRQQGIGDGGQLADQVQDYFSMFGSQFMDLQNQTSGVFQDIQSNVQNSFGQGFELVSQGFAQGFEQINQGWGDIQQQWGGGANTKTDNLMPASGGDDELRLEKNENNKMMQIQPNLLYRPVTLRYFTNRFVPYGLVRYNLVPLNLQQKQPGQEEELGRNMDVKTEMVDPIKAAEPSQ